VSIRFLALDVCERYGLNPETEWENMDKRVKSEMLQKRMLEIEKEKRIRDRYDQG